MWIPCHDGKGLQYRHTITQVRIRPGGMTSVIEDPEKAEEAARDTMARKRKLNMVMNEVLDASKFAIEAKYLLDFTHSEMKDRARNRQAFDQRKYLRDFMLKELDDGSSEYIRVTNNQVLNTLTADETDVFRKCPHVQQVFATGRPLIRHSGAFQPDERIASNDLTPRVKYVQSNAFAATSSVVHVD